VVVFLVCVYVCMVYVVCVYDVCVCVCVCVCVLRALLKQQESQPSNQLMMNISIDDISKGFCLWHRVHIGFRALQSPIQ
jgi:hypothetical protein